MSAALAFIMPGPVRPSAALTPPQAAELSPRSAASGSGAAIADTQVVTQTVYLPIIMAPPDVRITRVEVVQGITMNDTYRVHIADRAATVRVFTALSSTLPSQAVSARLTCYQGASQTGAVNVSSYLVNNTASDSVLNSTLNFSLAADSVCVDPGASFVVQLDPDNALGETDENNNRFPLGGTAAPVFTVADTLKVKFIPIAYQPGGAGPVYTPPTADISYLISKVKAVLPISLESYAVASPQLYTQQVLQDGTGWNALLNFVTSIHNSEGNFDTLYYGVVDTVAAYGCNSRVAGLGWIGSPTAIGDAGCPPNRPSATWTFIHEAGHNFGRSHVLCAGNETGIDPNYPYAGGQIGTWGLDVATNTLYNPGAYADYMSYCGSKWISDYTYKAIYDFRNTHAWSIIYTAQTMDALYLSGWTDAQGNVTLAPVYRQTAPVEAPLKGEYRAELRDAHGALLGSQLFDRLPIADGPAPAQGFHFFMPYMPGVAQIRIYRGNALLTQRTTSGAAPAVGAASVSADGRAAAWTLATGSGVVYRVRFSPDGGQTWTVLALGQSAPGAPLPQGWDKAARPVLEIQASDGVRTDTKVIPLKEK
jgi:hypothetical protein